MDKKLFSILNKEKNIILSRYENVGFIFINGSLARDEMHKYSDIDCRVYFTNRHEEFFEYKLIKYKKATILFNVQYASIDEIKRRIKNPPRWFWFYYGLKNNYLLHEYRKSAFDNLIRFMENNKPSDKDFIIYLAPLIGDLIEKINKLKSLYLKRDLINLCRYTEIIADASYYILRLLDKKFKPFYNENEFYYSYLKLKHVPRGYNKNMSICKKFVTYKNSKKYMDSLFSAGTKLGVSTILYIKDKEPFNKKYKKMLWLNRIFNSKYLNNYFKM
ncbi:nucleotidyltransferase domain-containing protein [Patescibacteria group bacterium]|nr:nucleotidyltransferase domain-containing protein [Patescibacteria group bacterium]